MYQLEKEKKKTSNSTYSLRRNRSVELYL